MDWPVSNSPGAFDYSLQTPSPKRRSTKTSPYEYNYSDRFIPSRVATNLDTGFTLLEPEIENQPANASASPPARDENNASYARLLRLELLGASARTPKSRASPSDGDDAFQTPEKRSLFRYTDSPPDDMGLQPPFLRSTALPSDAPVKSPRKIPRDPERVLHGPGLEDDFYLNVMDCSSTDVLAVALGTSVDILALHTGQTSRLLDLGSQGKVASVNWAADGRHLAIGTCTGEIQLWDAGSQKKLRTMTGHCKRVSGLAWNGHTLTSGSQDSYILHRDVRIPAHYVSSHRAHAEEVIGLKWSPDGTQLASGGNEGRVCIWNVRQLGQDADRCFDKPNKPEWSFCAHEAAVKALAWSPHKRGLLATGGGTADKCINMWNTQSGSRISSFCTGSQVCNLLWSKNTDELVSTHGYSGTEISLWRCPKMTRIASLHGHQARVLYLTCTANGQTIITGAGDETIRFWNMFPTLKRQCGGTDVNKSMGLLRTIR